MKSNKNFNYLEDKIMSLSYHEKILYLQILNDEIDKNNLLDTLKTLDNFFIKHIQLDNISTFCLVKLYQSSMDETLEEYLDNNELKKEVYLHTIKNFIKNETLNTPYYFKYLNLSQFSFSEIKNFFLEFFWNKEFIIEDLKSKNNFFFQYIDFENMKEDALEEFYIQTHWTLRDNWIKNIIKWSEKYSLNLPTNKKDLLKLTKIIFNDKKIKYIPKEIGKLQNLTEINFSNSNISMFSDNEIDIIPKEIFNLCNLNKLDISNNKLIHLSSDINKLSNLIELNLSNNLIEELPKEISEIISLKSLYISGNKLNTSSKTIFTTSMTFLPKEFESLKNLIILDKIKDNKKENESVLDFFTRKNYILN